jgi:CheY-like chemotaxis protein
VLSFEDDLANAELLEQLLARRADIRLLAARSGAEGIALALSQQPDIVLMDINLPDMTGLEAMKLMRAQPTIAHIPVIALSSNAYPRQIEDGLRAGFFLYLTKPYQLPELLKSIDIALLHSMRSRV